MGGRQGVREGGREGGRGREGKGGREGGREGGMTVIHIIISMFHFFQFFFIETFYS